jgi:hypothetical protein
MAVAFPILPGKTAEWRAWMEELNGARREDFVESRRRWPALVAIGQRKS